MGSKVLLADDSVTIQKVVGIIFANEGYELTTVATGDDALAKANEIRPDVMLIDALMPGKNGYEVCREIRQNPALAHTAILLMTGAFEVVDEEKNRASGADEFITKPFESQSLIDATNRMITLTAQRASASAAEPVAPVAVQAPAQSVDDVWATGFDMEPAVEVSPEPVFDVPAVPEITPVKATADDDLWGAFDMDAVEMAPFTPPAAPQTVQDSSDDFFSLETDSPRPEEVQAADEILLEEAVPAQLDNSTAAAANIFEVAVENEISFADISDEPASVTAGEKILPPAEDDFSTISFDEPVATPVPPVAEVCVEPAVPSSVPVPEPSPLPPAVEALPNQAVHAAAAAISSFDESQVKALLASLSRDVIEKIVWEVVPDLAERLIKDEIRKLKAGIA